MNGRTFATVGLLIAVAVLASTYPLLGQDASADPLPSWKDNSTKKRIVEFIEATTRPDSPQLVRIADRIAVFDNDGTLWAEQPVYFQAIFAVDRIRALAPRNPEWHSQEPFASVIQDGLKSLARTDEAGVIQLLAATHAGMTTEEFDETVRQWIATARHPETGRPYTEMIYQPMLELLEYLRENGYKTYIVSGGGVEFMRAWVEEVYGIPPEQVIGSSAKFEFEIRDSKPVLVKQAEIHHINDHAGKPMGIHRHIGRRPVIAFGNSDGDLQMLQWTAAGRRDRLGALIHHTDDEREYAYDRDSHIGRLDKALDVAEESGWLVVDMKRDWKVVFPPPMP
jgi:phosphoglycolate phosphatase-like HAD superfamily hydrolase